MKQKTNGAPNMLSKCDNAPVVERGSLYSRKCLGKNGNALSCLHTLGLGNVLFQVESWYFDVF